MSSSRLPVSDSLQTMLVIIISLIIILSIFWEYYDDVIQDTIWVPSYMHLWTATRSFLELFRLRATVIPYFAFHFTLGKYHLVASFSKKSRFGWGKLLDSHKNSWVFGDDYFHCYCHDVHNSASRGLLIFYLLSFYLNINAWR